MTSATWLLQSGAPAVVAEATTITGTTPFERRGVVLPFRRDQKQDFANSASSEVIKSNVRQILGTRCSDGVIPGEIPWLQSFGSLLYKLRHQNIRPVVRFHARALVVDALARWEPRVRVKRVTVEEGSRSIIIRTTFVVIDGFAVGRVDEEPLTVETEIPRAA